MSYGFFRAIGCYRMFLPHAFLLRYKMLECRWKSFSARQRGKFSAVADSIEL
jgi:hypothetical protein